jgi:enamine deaminase RidA (YjgF/YER057c/UK114 family)
MTKVLEAAGTTLANAVKINVYLADFDRDFVSMNQVYAQVGISVQI